MSQLNAKQLIYVVSYILSLLCINKETFPLKYSSVKYKATKLHEFI